MERDAQGEARGSDGGETGVAVLHGCPAAGGGVSAGRVGSEEADEPTTAAPAALAPASPFPEAAAAAAAVPSAAAAAACEAAGGAVVVRLLQRLYPGIAPLAHVLRHPPLVQGGHAPTPTGGAERGAQWGEGEERAGVGVGDEGGGGCVEACEGECERMGVDRMRAGVGVTRAQQGGTDSAINNVAEGDGGRDRMRARGGWAAGRAERDEAVQWVVREALVWMPHEHCTALLALLQGGMEGRAHEQAGGGGEDGEQGGRGGMRWTQEEVRSHVLPAMHVVTRVVLRHFRRSAALPEGAGGRGSAGLAARQGAGATGRGRAGRHGRRHGADELAPRGNVLAAGFRRVRGGLLVNHISTHSLSPIANNTLSHPSSSSNPPKSTPNALTTLPAAASPLSAPLPLNTAWAVVTSPPWQHLLNKQHSLLPPHSPTPPPSPPASLNPLLLCISSPRDHTHIARVQVGVPAMAHLLSHASIFVPLGASSFVQVAGPPVSSHALQSRCSTLVRLLPPASSHFSSCSPALATAHSQASACMVARTRRAVPRKAAGGGEGPRCGAALGVVPLQGRGGRGAAQRKDGGRGVGVWSAEQGRADMATDREVARSAGADTVEGCGEEERVQVGQRTGEDASVGGRGDGEGGGEECRGEGNGQAEQGAGEGICGWFRHVAGAGGDERDTQAAKAGGGGEGQVGDGLAHGVDMGAEKKRKKGKRGKRGGRRGQVMEGAAHREGEKGQARMWGRRWRQQRRVGHVDGGVVEQDKLQRKAGCHVAGEMRGVADTQEEGDAGKRGSSGGEGNEEVGADVDGTARKCPSQHHRHHMSPSSPPPVLSAPKSTSLLAGVQQQLVPRSSLFYCATFGRHPGLPKTHILNRVPVSREGAKQLYQHVFQQPLHSAVPATPPQPQAARGLTHLLNAPPSPALLDLLHSMLRRARACNFSRLLAKHCPLPAAPPAPLAAAVPVQAAAAGASAAGAACSAAGGQGSACEVAASDVGAEPLVSVAAEPVPACSAASEAPCNAAVSTSDATAPAHAMLPAAMDVDGCPPAMHARAAPVHAPSTVPPTPHALAPAAGSAVEGEAAAMPAVDAAAPLDFGFTPPSRKHAPRGTLGSGRRRRAGCGNASGQGVLREVPVEVLVQATSRQQQVANFVWAVLQSIVPCQLLPHGREERALALKGGAGRGGELDEGRRREAIAAGAVAASRRGGRGVGGQVAAKAAGKHGKGGRRPCMLSCQCSPSLCVVCRYLALERLSSSTFHKLTPAAARRLLLPSHRTTAPSHHVAAPNQGSSFKGGEAGGEEGEGRALGVAKVRFVPKAQSVRPIVNLAACTHVSLATRGRPRKRARAAGRDGKGPGAWEEETGGEEAGGMQLSAELGAQFRSAFGMFAPSGGGGGREGGGCGVGQGAGEGGDREGDEEDEGHAVTRGTEGARGGAAEHSVKGRGVDRQGGYDLRDEHGGHEHGGHEHGGHEHGGHEQTQQWKGEGQLCTTAIGSDEGVREAVSEREGERQEQDRDSVDGRLAVRRDVSVEVTWGMWSGEASVGNTEPLDASLPPPSPSQPPSPLSQPPSPLSQPPSPLSQPPSLLSQPPSLLSQPPSLLSQPPSLLSQPPSPSSPPTPTNQAAGIESTWQAAGGGSTFIVGSSGAVPVAGVAVAAMSSGGAMAAMSICTQQPSCDRHMAAAADSAKTWKGRENEIDCATAASSGSCAAPPAAALSGDREVKSSGEVKEGSNVERPANTVADGARREGRCALGHMTAAQCTCRALVPSIAEARGGGWEAGVPKPPCLHCFTMRPSGPLEAAHFWELTRMSKRRRTVGRDSDRQAAPCSDDAGRAGTFGLRRQGGSRSGGWTERGGEGDGGSSASKALSAPARPVAQVAQVVQVGQQQRDLCGAVPGAGEEEDVGQVAVGGGAVGGTPCATQHVAGMSGAVRTRPYSFKAKPFQTSPLVLNTAMPPAPRTATPATHAHMPGAAADVPAPPTLPLPDRPPLCPPLPETRQAAVQQAGKAGEQEDGRWRPVEAKRRRQVVRFGPINSALRSIHRCLQVESRRGCGGGHHGSRAKAACRHGAEAHGGADGMACEGLVDAVTPDEGGATGYNRAMQGRGDGAMDEQRKQAQVGDEQWRGEEERQGEVAIGEGADSREEGSRKRRKESGCMGRGKRNRGGGDDGAASGMGVGRNIDQVVGKGKEEGKERSREDNQLGGQGRGGGGAGDKVGNGVIGCKGEARQCREGRLGASVFGYSDAYGRYRAFVLHLRALLPATPCPATPHNACCTPAQQQEEGEEGACEEKQQQQRFNQQQCDWWRERATRVPPVYMAVCDVAQAYDTIPHAKLLDVMQEFVETPAFMVRHFSAIAPRANGLITPRSNRAAVPMAMAPEHACAAQGPATAGCAAVAVAAADQVQGAAAAQEAVEAVSHSNALPLTGSHSAAAEPTAATRGTAVSSATAAAVVAARPWQQLQACVPWWILQAGQSGACIVEDKGLTSLWRREDILQLLRRHISCHVIRAGRQFFVQRTGIPQGSVLSALLCSLFYAHLDRHVLLPSLALASPTPREDGQGRIAGQGGESEGNRGVGGEEGGGEEGECGRRKEREQRGESVRVKEGMLGAGEKERVAGGSDAELMHPHEDNNPQQRQEQQQQEQQQQQQEKHQDNCPHLPHDSPPSPLGGHSLLLRLIDDSLFISTSQPHVAAYVAAMHRGFPEYGCQANQSKTAVSFPLVLGTGNRETGGSVAGGGMDGCGREDGEWVARDGGMRVESGGACMEQQGEEGREAMEVGADKRMANGGEREGGEGQSGERTFQERVYEEEAGDVGEMAQGWEPCSLELLGAVTTPREAHACSSGMWASAGGGVVQQKRRFMRWAGLLVNCSTLEVQADYTRYWGTDMATSVTVSFCDPPAVAVPLKLRQFLRPKRSALLLDPAINSPSTLLVNAYQALRLAAIKLTAYCRARRLSPAAACTPHSRCLPRTARAGARHGKGQSSGREEKPWKQKRGGGSLAARGPCVCRVQAQFFTRAIISAINYYAGLIRSRLAEASREVGEPIPCIFTAGIVTFLGLSAFTTVLNAKRGVWKGVVVRLQERLHCREMAAVGDNPVVKQALHPSRHSVFQQICF
ncbi:unnamed protein product [Closterium sp. Naga37s-1]|nr:unnamed protein product [Closterium sp. Naga37s-1]